MLHFLLFVANLFVIIVAQIEIEVYDAKLFYTKINSSIYDANTHPMLQKPVTVNVSLHLDRWGPYDDAKSEFTISMQVYLKWFDERLAVTDLTSGTSSSSSSSNKTVHHFEADQIHLLQIWRPSIFFSNAASLSPDLLSDKANGQIMGKISINGKVQIVKRASITAVCKVNIKLYPVDVLECGIEFQSTSSERQLRLAWDELKPILFGAEYHWDVFDLIEFKQITTRTSYDVVGPFSRLEVNFLLRRKLGYFLIDVYLPSALFVISSWASFWIDIPAAPARVALVLTTMLTHVTSTKTIHDKHPRVSYIHSLDVWVMVCSMFIFAALIEYATANYFYHKRDRMKDKKLEGSDGETLSPVRRRTLVSGTHHNTTLFNAQDEYSLDASTSSSDSTRSRTLLKRAWKSMLSLVVPPFDADIETRRKALEIDRKSRIFFPITFLVFNIVYWSFLIFFSYTNRI